MFDFLHVEEELREMDDARRVGMVKLDAASSAERSGHEFSLKRIVGFRSAKARPFAERKATMGQKATLANAGGCDILIRMAGQELFVKRQRPFGHSRGGVAVVNRRLALAAERFGHCRFEHELFELFG